MVSLLHGQMLAKIALLLMLQMQFAQSSHLVKPVAKRFLLALSTATAFKAPHSDCPDSEVLSVPSTFFHHSSNGNVLI